LTDGKTSVTRCSARDTVGLHFFSPVHLCDRPGAVAAVPAVRRRYRLPVTTEMAHRSVNEMRRRRY
jgi:hypothetical protein